MINAPAGINRDKLVVDELCNILKKGCDVEEFKRAINELTKEEEKKEEDVEKQGKQKGGV